MKQEVSTQIKALSFIDSTCGTYISFMHIHSALVFATMYAVPFLHIILIPRVIVPPMGLLKRGMNAGA